MAKLQCVKIPAIDQCVCRSDAQKPTTFRLMRGGGCKMRCCQMDGACHPPGMHEAPPCKAGLHVARAKGVRI